MSGVFITIYGITGTSIEKRVNSPFEIFLRLKDIDLRLGPLSTLSYEQKSDSRRENVVNIDEVRRSSSTS
ncbi:hypothetical protein J31TS6_00740 [Brevibacillus reuszeri]|nr:hypothetical protein J31TS6_00740 [Brevibacillus reuszeri]